MKITFTGDISFTGNFKEALNNGNLNISNDIVHIFKNSDYNIVNLEGPTTSQPSVYDKDLNVTSPIKALDFLSKKLNVKIFNLANNHTFDAGLPGFMECKNEIKKRGFIYFGAGENILEAGQIKYLKKEDITVALIAIGAEGSSRAKADTNSFGVFSWNEDLVFSKIKEAKENSDWVVLNYHNGTEFNFYPEKSKQEKLKTFIDNGVDIVIAHHPHVIQGVENYNNGLIFYSLGNFIFDLNYHRKKKNSNLSLIPTIRFTKSNYDYRYEISKSSYKDSSVTLTKDHKEFFERICVNLTNRSSLIKLRQADALRCIFLNPFWSQHWWINICFPLLIPYRLYAFRKGNDKELLKEALIYFKCKPLYNYLIKLR